MAKTAAAQPGAQLLPQDLRSMLLREGIELARAGGPEAVPLRNVQRLAGVSHSAAYRHFADRAALLDAISAYAAEQMADRMRSAIASLDQHDDIAEDARARFCATGMAYLDFALTERGLFRVAFQTHTTADSKLSDGRAASPPFQLLANCLDDLVETGTLSPENRPYADIAAWSAVHGLAVLLLDGPLRQLPIADRAAAIERLITVIDHGTR